MLKCPSCHEKQEERIAEQSQPLQPDSKCSVATSDDSSTFCDSGSSENTTDGWPEPLTLNIHYEDQTYVKQLDYSIFARWENIEALLAGFEFDGAVIDGLWDVREDTPIGSGDWNARVYPGLEVDVTCWKPGCFGDEPSASSSDADSEEEEQPILWDGSRHHGSRWWFGRWRMKVEQETIGVGGPVHEPSQRTILLGALAMATFLGYVLVFCAG
jgi:hypothetical protein